MPAYRRNGFNNRVFVITGELSGEVHAVHLVRSLKALVAVEVSAVGSRRLAEVGAHVIFDYRDISATGLTEVVRKAGHIWKAYRTVKDHLRRSLPGLVILVDFPGFNLRVARAAAQLGIPVVYFIPPQVWAWRQSRLKQIKAWVDLVLCILPFEEDLFRRHAIPVSYVGHPYVQLVKPVYSKEDFFSRFHIDKDKPVLTIMPGSRENELRRHMPILMDVVRRIEKESRGLTVLLPVAESISIRVLDPYIHRMKHLIPVEGLPHDCLKHADAAVVSSGSATLEAAILGVPSIVVYRISSLSYAVARMVVKVKHISLPNIIAGKEVFPEFVQSIDPGAIAKAVLSMINNEMTGIQREMEQVRNRLGSPQADPYRTAAGKIVELLEEMYGPLL
jgi:lipid-A-disaccharide synthase